MERLTVFLGAGASAALGIASTVQVTDELLRLDGSLTEPGSRPIISTLLELLKKCYHSIDLHSIDQRESGNPVRSDTCNCVNFEHLIHALEMIGSIIRGDKSPPDKRAVEAFITDGLRAELNEFSRQTDFPSFVLDRIYETIHRLFVVQSRNATNSPRWETAIHFWRELRSRYKLDIVTTNYDTVIEDVFQRLDERLNQGFDEENSNSSHLFSFRRLSSTEHSRLMHLHGSVHFGIPDNAMFRSGTALWEDLCFYDDAENALVSCRGARSTNSDQTGKDCRIGSIITGMQKPSKLLAAEPYASYYSGLLNCLQTNRRLLVAGYGFMDHHINNLLSRFAIWHGLDRRVVCLNRGDSFGSGFLLNNTLYRSETLHRLAGNGISRSSAPSPFESGMVEDNPWTSPDRTMRLYLDGFLSGTQQSESVMRFMES